MFENRDRKRRLNEGLVLLLVVVATLGVGTWLSGAAHAALQANGVALGPDHTRQAMPDQNILYRHTLTNTGTVTDTFDLQVVSSQDWPVELLSTIQPEGTTHFSLQLGAQMTASLQVSLTVPRTAGGARDTTTVTATSQSDPALFDVALDTTEVPARVLFPFIAKRWPPIPFTPVLQPIENPDFDGVYTVDWSVAQLANTYVLEQDIDPGFPSPQEVFSGAATSWTVPEPGKVAGTYYYRVRGHNTFGFGGYSNVQGVMVRLPEVPVLSDIGDADGNGFYTVQWSAAARATSYILQEATNPDFTSPAEYTRTDTSWPATNKAPGTYYYRVRAAGPTGQSDWSNTQSVTVQRFRLDTGQLPAGQCTILRWDFDNIRSIHVSLGYGYDKVGVTGHGSAQVCPSVDTTYEAFVVRTDGSAEVYKASVDVTGTGCGDPVIYRFSPTATEVRAGEKFSIFWDVECAESVHLIISNGPAEPVTGHGSRIDLVIYSDTLFQLEVEKQDGAFVYASFTVAVVP
jgi:hypothetical protein